MTRRAVLAGSGVVAIGAGTAVILGAGTRGSVGARAGQNELVLEAGKTLASLMGERLPQVPVWGYNGLVPGPEIRVRQGQPFKALLKNNLDEGTTIHWHGLRVPNAMDGVPHLTQDPVEPGQAFLYEFTPADAGTFWYHPHQRSFEQVGRGLYGPLIIEEADSPRVDRDITWVLDDWRMSDSGQISGGFGSRHDAMMAGRIGNTITINAKPPKPLEVRPNERIRLRLVNAANARIFGLDFSDIEPVIIALDGQPVEPHTPSGPLLLGPAQIPNIDNPTAWPENIRDTIEAIAGARSAEALTTNMGYATTLRDPAFLTRPDITLDKYGELIEITVHNWMHMRFAASPPADFEDESTANDWLGAPFSSHVNKYFWKLHGWIDDCIGLWEIENEKQADFSSAWRAPEEAPPWDDLLPTPAAEMAIRKSKAPLFGPLQPFAASPSAIKSAQQVIESHKK